MNPLSESQIINALVKYKGIDEVAAKRIAQRAEGNLDSANKLINQEENTIQFETLFIDWVRTAFQAKTNKKSINKLMSWSETVAN